MPLNSHFGGHGNEVMASMKKSYAPKKAESVFYATENAQKSKAAPPKALSQKPRKFSGTSKPSTKADY